MGQIPCCTERISCFRMKLLNIVLIVVMQMKDIFDNDQLIVGPYDWRWCTGLTRFITYPDQYFRQVNFCSAFWQMTVQMMMNVSQDS